MDFGTPSTSRYRAIADEPSQDVEPRRRSTNKTPISNSSPDFPPSADVRASSKLPANPKPGPSTRDLRSQARRSSSATTDESSTRSSGVKSSDSTISRVIQGSRLRLQSLFRSFSNSSSPICRICHEGDAKEDLVSPCYCSGTMGLVHVTCMERWLSSANSDVCELCHYKFKTKKTPKSFIDWLKDSSARGRYQRSLVGDGVCFTLLTPLAFVGAFLCIEGAHQQAVEGNRMEAGCLVALSSVLAVVYLLWTGLTCRYYYRQFNQWQLTNHKIQMIYLERDVRRDPLPASSLSNVESSANHPQSDFPQIEEVVIENQHQQRLSLNSSTSEPSVFNDNRHYYNI